MKTFCKHDWVGDETCVYCALEDAQDEISDLTSRRYVCEHCGGASAIRTLIVCRKCANTILEGILDCGGNGMGVGGMKEQQTTDPVTYPFQGKRVELIPQPGGFQLLKPGEYGRWTDGTWHAETPNGHGCNLSAHHVTEHNDGTISVSHDATITVSPSILITGSRGEELWHGWLERGIWRLA